MCPLPEEVMNNQKLDGNGMEAEKVQHIPEMEQMEEMAVALDSMESYEDFIDRIYLKTFTSSTPEVEALDTCKAYADWIDEKFRETFNMSSISVDAEDKVTLNEVVRKEFTEMRQESDIEDKRSVKKISDRVQREPYNIFGSECTDVIPSHCELQLSLARARSIDHADGIRSGLKYTTACQLFSPIMLRVPMYYRENH